VWGALLTGLLLLAVPQPLASLRAMAFAACLRQTGISLLAAALIALLATRTGAPVFGVLRRGVLPWLGSISYALYMLHLYVLWGYDRLRGPLQVGDTLAYGERFAAVLAGTLALSLVSRHALELPAMSLRRYVLARPAAACVDEPAMAIGDR
jgi:peptidoglycan/LPS O-acetylase OafA/YrhL